MGHHRGWPCAPWRLGGGDLRRDAAHGGQTAAKAGGQPLLLAEVSAVPALPDVLSGRDIRDDRRRQVGHSSGPRGLRLGLPAQSPCEVRDRTLLWEIDGQGCQALAQAQLTLFSSSAFAAWAIAMFQD